MGMIDEYLKEIAKTAEIAIPAKKGDYIGDDGLLYCAECQTPKETVIDLCGEKTKVRCLCKCGIEKRDEERRKQYRIELENWRLHCIENIENCGLPNSIIGRYTFAEYKGNFPAAKNVCEKYCANFGEMLDNGEGLLFYGNKGTGKTYLANCIANELTAQKYSVFCTNIPELVSAMRESENMLKYICRIDLLVLDDIGTERNTPYMLEKVFSVVDARTRQNKPIVFTTNLSMAELKSDDNIAISRVYDRILQKCYPVSVSGESFRKTDTKDRFFAIQEKLK